MGLARACASVVATVAAASSVTVLAAEQPVPLRPSGKWTLGAGDTRCVLERAYGPADSPTMLAFIPGTLGTRPAVRLLESLGDERGAVRSDQGSVTLEPGGRALPVDTHSYAPIAGQHRMTIAYLPEVGVSDLVLATLLTFERGKAAAPLAIAPGGSAQVVDALERCEAERLHRLGIDPAADPVPARAPEPVGGSAGAWFHPRDYPHVGATPWRFGHVVARVQVTTEGRVGQCAVAQGSGAPMLDNKTCDLLRSRGRYVPALDASGRPTAAFAVVPVNWEPPRR